VQIATQSNLTTTTSTQKQNLRLVRASQYLSTFNLRVIYKPGRIYAVPDALSRLIGERETQFAEGYEALDMSYNDPDAKLEGAVTTVEVALKHRVDEPAVFHVALVEISDDMREKIKDSYAQDPVWAERL
jgi:coproporphyrinogen III oxidase-like Fe-S oxidoreductase